MKQYSAAKLTKPLMRRPGARRGAGDFVEIEWDEALDILTARLKHIRASDPTKLAFFTGRDQMQALSGMWAQQFGTPNWAAHGGFCSVNMAVAGLYTIGYSFWEFGAPDWDHAKYFMLWGVAEDHSSNPMKIGLDKLKRRGAKFVSINPVRTGYSAIADEWLPIRPGTDGLLALAIVHVLLKRGAIDWEFLIRYTNAPWLVVQTPGVPGDGLFARDENDNPLVWDHVAQVLTNGHLPDIAPALLASVELPDGRRAKTVFSLISERYLDERYSPEQRRRRVRRAAPRRSPASRTRWRTSRSTRRSSCRSDGPTCTGARTTRSSAGRLRCTRCAASRRTPTASRPAARCTCCRCCWARSKDRATFAPARRIRGASRCGTLPENDPTVIFAPGHAAEAHAQRQSDAARGSGHRQGRQAAAHRPGVLVGIAARRARADAHGDHQRRQPRSLPDRHAAAVHGEHGVEFVDEHRRRARHAGAQGRARRIRDTVPRRRRRVPVRDRQFRRPRSAGHDLSGTLRRDLAARPADLGARCGRRFDPPSDPQARSRRRPWQDVLVELASRLKFPAFTDDGRLAQVRRLPRFHRQLRETSRNRLSRRLARQGRRVASARRTEPEAVGKVHRAPVVLHLSVAGEHALLPVREQGLPRIRREARAVRNAAGAGDPADVFGAAAEVSPRRAGSLRRPAATVADRPRAAGDLFRSAAVLVRAAGNPRRRRAKRIRSTRSRSGR